MTNNRFLKDEYDGYTIEDYPITREKDYFSAEYSSVKEIDSVDEYTENAPEYTPVGYSVLDQSNTSDKNKKFKRGIKYLASIAVIALLFHNPLQLFTSTAKTTPSEESTSIEETTSSMDSTKESSTENSTEDSSNNDDKKIEENHGDAGDVSIEIEYAIRDENTVKYTYWLNYHDCYPAADVYSKVVTYDPYREVESEYNPDTWFMSRNLFEYEIDITDIADATDLYLVLTAHFKETEDSTEEKEVTYIKQIIDKPTEPEFHSEIMDSKLEDGIFYVNYDAILWYKDTVDHPITVKSFAFKWYNKDKEPIGGGMSVYSYYDSETDSTIFIEPEMTRIGSANGWSLTYYGPTNLQPFSEVAYYTIALEIQETDTGLFRSTETDLQEFIIIDDTTYEEPECEAYLFSHFSEMFGSIKFANMDHVQSVKYQIWDIDNNTLEQEIDITDEAINDGAYYPKKFTTDIIYDNHQDYYESINKFPMDCLMKIVIDYESSPGAISTMTYEANNIHVWADFEPDFILTAPWEGWEFPVDSFHLWIKDFQHPFDVVYNGTEEDADENTVVVNLTIDDDPTIIESETSLNTWVDENVYILWDEELTIPELHSGAFSIKRLTSYGFDAGHIAHFVVYYYVELIDEVVELHFDIEF